MSWQPGPIRRLWYNWKMMRLPWRKKWLVGFDLSGNTFWEFKDALSSKRFRRIVKYRETTHHGDVNVTPHWMQWLRHTRHEPPSLAEQRNDIIRQERMKLLAAQADARWASKPSALDPPTKQQPIQMLISRDTESGVGQMNAEQQEVDENKQPESVEDVRAQSGDTHTKDAKSEIKDSPWKTASRGGPGEEWQPDSWKPSPARRRV